MFTAKQYRAKSNACGELSKEAVDPGQIRKYQDSQDSFRSVAANEEWLANNSDKMVKLPAEAPAELSSEKPSTYETLAAEEDRVLRSLGASAHGPPA
jgi:hypothetical protein